MKNWNFALATHDLRPLLLKGAAWIAVNLVYLPARDPSKDFIRLFST